jgi:hypothetical protein
LSVVLGREIERLVFGHGLSSPPCDHWGFRVVISYKEEFLEFWDGGTPEAEGTVAEADTTTERTE